MGSINMAQKRNISMGFEHDIKWSDNYLPRIKELLGSIVLSVSSFERDTTQATDLIVLKAVGKSFACRMRREGYANKYPFDVTFRTGRISGATTELEKIMQGYCDYAFYGHAKGADQIERYFVLDLNEMRKNLKEDDSKIIWSEKYNKDQATKFINIDVRSFRPSVIVKSSHEVNFI